ncbi:winged helix-turn-helix transcriptional regulator [Paracoccus limosus]|uniref:Winged helix-turn-helix transcriptional regulator n=1 Tax=Paracoccus limosus TaxID=913252 RepID=A0A844H358_9RHOB|nr:winged helix-turn-helix transcriptional regulator [Paracoccus limosus]
MTQDDTDRRLLTALRGDARMSVTELAHSLGISRTTVRQRMDALVASGRIRRFTIETDVAWENEIRAITMVELQGSMSRAVIRQLNRIPDVAAVYATSGVWDLVVEIRTDTLAGFDRVLREIREIPGVVSSQSCLLLAHMTS